MSLPFYRKSGVRNKNDVKIVLIAPCIWEDVLSPIIPGSHGNAIWWATKGILWCILWPTAHPGLYKTHHLSVSGNLRWRRNCLIGSQAYCSLFFYSQSTTIYVKALLFSSAIVSYTSSGKKTYSVYVMIHFKQIVIFTLIARHESHHIATY